MIDVTSCGAVQLTVPQLEIGRDERSVSSPKDDIGNECDGSAKRQWVWHWNGLGQARGQELVVG